MIRSAALRAGPVAEVDDGGLRISIRLTITFLALAVGAVIAAQLLGRARADADRRLASRCL